MHLQVALQLAVRALLRNKMRTGLTMLGIVVGVAAVITMMAIATAARNGVQEKIAKMGTNVLVIYPGSTRTGGMQGGAQSKDALSIEDVAAILKECRTIVKASPICHGGSQVVFGNQNWSTTIRGVGADFSAIRNCPLQAGRFILASDVAEATRVCVIGHEVEEKVFTGQDPVGAEVRLENVPFTVVGVIEERGDTHMGGDDEILIPYTTALKRVRHSRRATASLDSVGVLVRSREEMDRAKDDITALLRQRHGITGERGDDFEVIMPFSYLQTMDESSRSLTLLLAGVASVSLLVGGIGIMNILLVSVTERIREIGIRMALGARRRDIMWQFLTEALLLAVVGGLVGIGLGYGVAHLAQRYSSLEATVSTHAVVLAFGFSAMVGIFSGFYPAVKASRMAPIEALRHQ